MIGIRHIPGMYSKWESCTMHVLGDILFGLAISMIPCLAFSLWNNEPALPFLLPIVICFLLSAVLIPFFKLPSIVKPVDGLFMVGLVWFVAIIVGSIPFVLSGMEFVDSIFESTSGMTTTGATIMADIESWSSGILLWRSMMQWVGGIAIILLFLFILPMIGFGGRAMFGNEMSGSGTRNLSVRMRDAAKQFSFIYGILTFALIIFLLALGTSFYDSLCMAFSTISTGGFMCKNDSLIGYSDLVKIVITVFMFLGGTNFYIHFKAIYHRERNSYIKNEEFIVMALWFTLAVAIVYIILFGKSISFDGEFLDNICDITFNVVSAGTTTGFVSYDYEQWFPAATAILFFVAVLGGSTGSTSGGIKIGRLIVVMRYAGNVVNRMLHPKGVYDVKLNGSSVDDESLSTSIIIVLLFVTTIVIGSIILMLCGTSFTDSLTNMIGCLTTFGPGINEYGPMGSYQNMGWYTKLFLAFIMWLGRLEILTGLIIITPGFWKEFMMSRKKKNDRMSCNNKKSIKY